MKRITMFFVIILLVIMTGTTTQAQSFSSTTGIMQGERIARVTQLSNQVLKAESTKTAWLPIGTHSRSLSSERVFAPTKFTAFVLVDTAGIPHGADPEIYLKAELALTDTSVIYHQRDYSLDLATTVNPITVATTGLAIPVPVYGGGYLRFVISSVDTARVQLDLWRVR